jgi:hypothetical protein
LTTFPTGKSEKFPRMRRKPLLRNGLMKAGTTFDISFGTWAGNHAVRACLLSKESIPWQHLRTCPSLAKNKV